MTSLHWFIFPVSPPTACCHVRSWVIAAVEPRPPLRMAVVIPEYCIPVGAARGLTCGGVSSTVHCVISAGGSETPVLVGSSLVPNGVVHANVEH